MSWFDNIDFSKVTVNHRWNGMADRFDVEQGILSCWNITDDIDLLYQKVLETDMTKDEIANYLLGVKSIYHAKFESTFSMFEDSIRKEFGRCVDLQNTLNSKQAVIDRLMLEYCPEEMSEDQLKEWGRNQIGVDVPAKSVCTNLDLIIKGTEHLLDKKFIELSTGKKYTFIGIIVGSDDYYYGMYSKKSGLVSLSCVGGIEAFGFEMVE